MDHPDRTGHAARLAIALLRDRSGASVVEYGLLVALLGVVISYAVAMLRFDINEVFARIIAVL